MWWCHEMVSHTIEFRHCYHYVRCSKTLEESRGPRWSPKICSFCSFCVHWVVLCQFVSQDVACEGQRRKSNARTVTRRNMSVKYVVVSKMSMSHVLRQVVKSSKSSKSQLPTSTNPSGRRHPESPKAVLETIWLYDMLITILYIYIQYTCVLWRFYALHIVWHFWQHLLIAVITVGFSWFSWRKPPEKSMERRSRKRGWTIKVFHWFVLQMSHDVTQG